MRSLMFLVAALVTVESAIEATEFKMPDGFPDGAVLTFYFWHAGDSSDKESTAINFYDLPSVDIHEEQDITAHLRFDRELLKPVTSNTYADGKWLEQTTREQPLDEMPPRDGWWRVDVIKHDAFRLNVFFQGFWSDVRLFDKSLDNITSVYLSQCVDHKKVQIRMKLPNSNIDPITYYQFKHFLFDNMDTNRRLISFPNFTIGSRLELVAVLRASAGAKIYTPALAFKNNTHDFLKIYQNWNGETEELHITSNGKQGMLCSNEMPHGDLQHLNLKRLSQNGVRLEVLYKRSGNVTCEFTIPDDLAKEMDKPFEIMGQNGALIFHLDHSIPKRKSTTKA